MKRLAAEPFAIRPADRRDLDALVEIEARAFRHPWTRPLLARELDHDWSTLLVAFEPEGAGADEGIRGFCVFWTVYDEAHLLDLAVHPDHRRRGVGTALLDALIGRARQGGGVRVALEVRRSNVAAQRLYRLHGFRPVGVRPRYYVHENEDAIQMELELRPPEAP